jgi:hypothetical protein
MIRSERDGRVVRRTGNAVQAWLDGDGSEAAARRSGTSGARDVALWKRIEAEAARRREVRVPRGLSARIMAALSADDEAPPNA